MSGAGFVVTVFLLVLGVAWLALPFLNRNVAVTYEEGDKGRDRLNLAAAYERALLMVRDLDEDYNLGKLPQDVYTAERARLIEQGAALLQAFEQSGGSLPTKSKRKKSDRQAAVPAPAAPTPAAEEIDPVEQAIAAYTRAREQSQGR